MHVMYYASTNKQNGELGHHMRLEASIIELYNLKHKEDRRQTDPPARLDRTN